jgi:hypothetical protein
MKNQSYSTLTPAPVLAMFTLAVMAMIQLLFPNLIPPGLTLVVIGVVFLVLYFTRLVQDALTLILGWMLTGFGVSFWASTQPQWSALALPVILIGLGLGFVGIYLSASAGGLTELQTKHWPLLPALMLLSVAAILIAEGIFGRQRLWSLVVPLIPAASAVWYLVSWRRAAEAARAREG